MLIFPKEHIVLKPKEQRLIKVASFIDEISGLALITYWTRTLKAQ